MPLRKWWIEVFWRCLKIAGPLQTGTIAELADIRMKSNGGLFGMECLIVVPG
jgi:hypothetical protein